LDSRWESTPAAAARWLDSRRWPIQKGYLNMHEKRFEGDIGRLRSSERVSRLEVDRVVELCLAYAQIAQMLDVGTGTGLFAEGFSRRGVQVSGVDVNPEMLAAAQGFVPAGDFRQGIAEALPYTDSAFDLAFLGLVLHESDDTLKALQEAFRVTRKRVAILEWPYREQSFGPPLAHRLTTVRLRELFEQAGFRTWQEINLINTVLYLLEK
jgi:ubiquinone/menaquinone biosynthesis C-methylase UbiE